MPTSLSLLLSATDLALCFNGRQRKAMLGNKIGSKIRLDRLAVPDRLGAYGPPSGKAWADCMGTPSRVTVADG